jgi:adenine-specific DNA methylase
MTDERPDLKIQDDLPIRAAGIETQRERNNYSDLPPQNYIHVWWARRPTPATRLALLSSVLPETVSDDQLLRWMGIDPDNNHPDDSVAEHVRKKRATKDQRDGFVYEHYGYRKSYKNLPNLDEVHEVAREQWDGDLPTVLDATAGGGAIPFESVRYEFPTVANELNPVASVILKAVLEHPRGDNDLSDDIRKWGEEINRRAAEELSVRPSEEGKENPDGFFPPASSGQEPLTYLWAHTVTCPDCGTEVPLSPNWWIDRDEDIAVKPTVEDGTVEFELINAAGSSDHDPASGSVSYGKGECIGCGVQIEGDEIKTQAQNDKMGYQLYCVEYRNKYDGTRGNFRTPVEKDIEAFEEAAEVVQNDFELSVLLDNEIPSGQKTDEPRRYGMTEWRDMYSPRQLLVHYTYWQKFEEVRKDVENKYSQPIAESILTYLSITADKAIDHNNHSSYWDNSTPKVRGTFDRHDFAFKWSFAEINQTGDDIGYDWCLDTVVEVYEELRDLSGTSNASVTISQEDAADLPTDAETVDAIVLDPPYYDNVMYAELSDFFYIWLKKYLGDVYPDFFEGELTPKGDEAVANESKFNDVVHEGKSKSELAKQDYEQKMSEIFDEMHRVLDDDGVFTLMFTHKKVDAWDTLTKALINAGFVVTATHPVSTESRHSLHQKGKNAAESTILLASEKRDSMDQSPTLFEDIKRETREVARQKTIELDQREIEFAKVDIILAAFGPTLEVFTENYPVVDAEGNEVSPQQALDEARGAVRDYFIDRYLTEGVRNIDSRSEWYLLAWLLFEAERFPYDEARRLAIGLGEDLGDLKRPHRMWRKRSGDVVLRPHDERVQDITKSRDNRSSRKPVDPDSLSFATTLDKVHAAMHVYDAKGEQPAWNWLNSRDCGSDPEFKTTLKTLLQVLPQTHDDWELARDLVVGETGELLEVSIDPGVFEEGEDGDTGNHRLEEFEEDDDDEEDDENTED